MTEDQADQEFHKIVDQKLAAGEFDCAAMVSHFDEGAKGALTFDEFCRMANVVGLRSFLNG